MTRIAAPDRVLVDERVPVRVSGLSPGERVTLRVRRESDPADGGVVATFEADGEGVVDPAEQAPVDGDYAGVRPMGLFQFRPARDREADGAIEATVTASVDGEVVASTTVERGTRAEGVTTAAVDDPELVGDLFLPAGEGPHPGVVLLGGSGGGRPPSLVAELLASRGYAVLGLAYFGAEGRPDELVDVPFEYFERAVEWFGARPSVRSEPLGVVGFSRGGEPALLLGARRPEVRTVVGYAASPVHFQGISRSGATGGALAEDGESLPYVPFRWGARGFARLAYHWLLGRPMSFVPAYRGGIEDADPETLEAATIPVEEVGGPVLLISGADDRLWNATELGDRAVERLAARDYDHPYEHAVYEDAGHGILVPYVGVEGRESSGGGSRFRMAMGGTPEGYAEADVDAWERVLSFLERGLGRPDDAPRRSAGTAAGTGGDRPA